MESDLSHRLGYILGTRPVSMAERLNVLAAAGSAQTWDDLSDAAKRLIGDLELRPTWGEAREILKPEGSAATAASARTLLPAFDRDGDPSERDIARWARAAGTDTHPGGEGLKHYWTQDPEGLALWADSPHPWTALYDHLITKIKNPEKTARIVSAWYQIVFHGPVGWKKGKNPDGPG